MVDKNWYFIEISIFKNFKNFNFKNWKQSCLIWNEKGNDKAYESKQVKEVLQVKTVSEWGCACNGSLRKESPTQINFNEQVLQSLDQISKS